MASGLLAFQLSKPIETPKTHSEQGEWRGSERAEAGCYCTRRGYKGYCRPRYEGSSMTCNDWGWGTLECWCV